jgi:hypothetical protein
VITAMFEEAVHRDPEGQKRWVALVDGNETQIRLLERLAEERDLAVPIVVDFIHVAEYVWEAAKALFPDDKKKQNRWVLEHMREILRGKGNKGGGRDQTKCHIRQNGVRRAQTCGCLSKLPAEV